MKYVRTFLFLLVAGLMLSGTALAQGDLSLGGGSDDLSAGIVAATFSGSASMAVELIHPYHVVDADSIPDSVYTIATTGDTVHTVSARSDAARVYKFHIANLTGAQDTLRAITIASFNDEPYMFENIYLYRSDTTLHAGGTKIAEVLDLGSLTNFSENTPLAFSGLNDTIPDGDTVFYWFEVDVDSASVHPIWNDEFAGLKVFQNGIELATNGFAPTGPTDTLRYNANTTWPHTFEASTGHTGDGRVLVFDTKPPEVTVDFALVDFDSCSGNGMVNLGDSIFITAWDTVEVFEIYKAYAQIQVFGGGAAEEFTDTLVVGADSAMTLGWKLPETSITPPLDVASGFWYLIVTVEDEPGNRFIDSLLVPFAIDNQKPLFDGDSVWVDLVYDANSDGIAAIGDTVQVFAYMTTNPFDEVDSVWADMTNWGYVDTIILDDAAGDRRYTRRLGLTQGVLDLGADSSGSRFWVWAYDNACNWNLDSAVAHFAIDNDPPDCPVTATYTRDLDLDSNNIINLFDDVAFEIDASNTLDLGTTCEVSLDLMNSGLGGSQIQCVEDTNSFGNYIYTWTVADGGFWSVDIGANIHRVAVTLTDDAGNVNVAACSTSQMPFRVDTDPPEPVTLLTPTQGPCAIMLDWHSGNADDSLYLIFWDGGDGVWDVADSTTPVGSSSDTIWTTDGTVTVSHGLTYQFFVRTIDDANNTEFNFTTVAMIADCEAPDVCIDYPMTSGAYGVFNSLPLFVSTDASDVATCSLYVRDQDAGTGTPGPWTFYDLMSQVGGGQQFVDTIDQTGMTALFSYPPNRNVYDVMTVGVDTLGNGQTWPEALAACSAFEFTWFYVGLAPYLVSVNGAVSEQTGCGFDITLDSMNLVEIHVPSFLAGDTYTVDVFQTTLDDATKRVNYYEGIDAMPFQFYLDATNFDKSTNTVWVRVTRNDQNTGTFPFNVCAPDTVAPSASILFPIDGQRVRKMNSTLRPLNVWARVNDWAYDPSPVTRVEFEHALFSDFVTNGESAFNVFDIQTAYAMGDTFQGNWNNMAFVDGDTVLVRAVFFDDLNNTQATPYITVYLDAFATDIVLTCVQAADVNGVPTLAGIVDFHAEIHEAFNDFQKLELYVRKTTDPDVFANYTLIGTMGPATDEGTYVWYGYNTAGLTSNIYWDFRVIATDITNNVMWDYDDDGFFDDNTFDPTGTINSDMRWFVDNMAAPIAFNQFEANGVTFYTPSTKLGGTGQVYAQARADLTVWSQTIPMSDSTEVARIRYGWMPANPGAVTWVTEGAADPWYTATFNPYTLGLYTDDDIMNRFTVAWIVVEKLDVLNRPVVTDTIMCTILDIDANQALITSLLWQNYYWGNISLTAGALNAYNMLSVTYEYATEAAPTTWNEIATSYNVGGSFPATWQTLGVVPDGWVWVRAVLTDSSFNVDTDPISTRIFIANELPNATLQSVSLASGTAVTDSGFIGHNTIFVASASHDNQDIPIDSVLFMYKSVLSGSWITWSRDYYPPYNAQWTNAVTSDGSFHYRVRAYNRAGRFVDSDYWTLYNDETNPTIAATMICGQDVEANNDPQLDLNACMPVAALFGEFWDNGSWSGANSGIVKVAFELRDNSGSAMYYQTVDPATGGEQTSSFNISGLPEGTYRFYFYAWDLVGNQTTFGPVNGYITDQTPPVTSVIGYYGNRLYGYDWSGDATEVLFQYQDGGAWIGIGTGTNMTGNYWWTEFDASSISGTYNFRLLASDGTNSNEATAILISGTADGNGALTFAAGELTDMVVLKNYENDIFEGVLRVTAPSANEPVALAVYQTDFNDPPGFYYERVDLNPNTPGGTLFQEDVHPDWDVICGGYSIYFVGSADGTGAVMTMIQTYTYWDDLPSTYTGNGGTVTVDLPDGDHNGCMVIMETWLPRSGEPQDDWVPVANHNGGIYANYIGCGYELDLAPKADGGGDLTLSSGCCFGNNRYAQITMSYDPSIDAPVEDLAVLRWDPWNGLWKSDGIYDLSADAWFDTENHTVQFSTECLYGIFTVAQQVDPDTGQVSIVFYDANPWCCEQNGETEVCYTSPVQVGELPKFTFHITTHDFLTINNDRFVVKLDDFVLHEWGTDDDKWTVDWHTANGYNGMLDIYMTDYAGDVYDVSDEDHARPLDCGPHTLYIEAKNSQGGWNSLTWTFNVDCTPPVVVFDNYYVAKNPTITFTLSDTESGIDWEKVFVDVVAIEINDTNSARPNQDDNLFFLGTFFPGQVEYYYDEITGVVTITTHYNLQDERSIAVAIYDGVRTDNDYDYSQGDPVRYGDWSQFYLEDHGMHDCVGNPADPWFQVLSVDYDGPVILAEGETQWSKLDALPNDCPVLISIADDGSGINEVFIYENDVLISEADGDLEAGEYILDGGYLRYCKTSGVRTRIVATDNVGNSRERTWSAFGNGEYEDAGMAYNFPNPFDPSLGEKTKIEPGFNGNGITVKIYDFGGELVATVNETSSGFYWNGFTDDGTRVANGIYFAYCTTQDGQHKVVKIAVIEK